MTNFLTGVSARISRVCNISSQRTDYPTADRVGVSIKPSSKVPKTNDGRPIISGPVPDPVMETCKSDGQLNRVTKVPEPLSSQTRSLENNTRLHCEMPLSCHPPFEQSWIETQPLTKHAMYMGDQLVPGVSVPDVLARRGKSKKPPSQAGAITHQEPPRPSSSLPSARTPLPPPPIPPRHKLHSKREPANTLHISTPTNLFDQPIAPLRPTHDNDGVDGSAQSSLQAMRQSTRRRYQSAVKASEDGYLPVPSVLLDPWANRRSSRIIMADNTLQMKTFSELNVELKETMRLYTPSKKP